MELHGLETMNENRKVLPNFCVSRVTWTSSDIRTENQIDDSIKITQKTLINRSPPKRAERVRPIKLLKNKKTPDIGNNNYPQINRDYTAIFESGI